MQFADDMSPSHEICSTSLLEEPTTYSFVLGDNSHITFQAASLPSQQNIILTANELEFQTSKNFTCVMSSLEQTTTLEIFHPKEATISQFSHVVNITSVNATEVNGE